MVAFTPGSPAFSRPKWELVPHLLLEELLMVALSSSHPLAHRQSVPLLELANEPFILFHSSSPYSYGGYLIQCEAAGFTPRAMQRTGEMQTATSLVSAGIGVTLVPASVQNFQREGVVYVPLAAPAPTIGLTLATHENDLSSILRHFLQIVRKTVA